MKVKEVYLSQEKKKCDIFFREKQARSSASKYIRLSYTKDASVIIIIKSSICYESTDLLMYLQDEIPGCSSPNN